MKKYVFAFLPLLTIHPVHAQQPVCALTISGSVTDEHDRSPLEFATVVVVGTTKGATCDVEGHFRITGLCPGTIVLEVSHLGCTPQRRTVKLEHDEVIDLSLEHHAEELKELQVLRERPDENVGQPVDEADRATMERATGRTLGEMLAQLPGVNVLSSGPTIAKPVINGLYGSRILTLNQGVRQEDQQWGTEHAPNLDPFTSERITVVKGASAVQYGADALGGVIITDPVELPTSPGLRGDLRGFGMANERGGGGNGSLEGGVRGWNGAGWRLQGGGRALGDSRAPDYVLSNTGVRELGASAAIGLARAHYGASAYYSWFARELGILRASHIGNLTDLEEAIASDTPWYTAPFTHAIAAPRQTVQHHLLRTSAYWRPGERSQLDATYAYQADDRQEYDVRRGDLRDTPALDLFLATHTADLVMKHWLGDHVHGKAGLSGSWQENFNVPGTGVRPLIPNYTRGTAGAFALEHLPLSERTELEVGGRVETTQLNVAKYDSEGTLLKPEHRFDNAAFAVGANWSVSDSLRLRFNLGTAYRPPNVSELYSEGLHHGAAAIEVGDPGLDNERSLMGSVDLESTWCGGRLAVDLTVYANRINGYIYLRPDDLALTVRGAFPVFEFVATDALLAGGDATLTFQLLRELRVRSQWSLVQGSEVNDGAPLYLMPPARTQNMLQFERPALGSWRAISCALISTYVFEQTRYPESVDFAPPPPAYHLLGLSAGAAHAIGRNELRIGLEVSNLLNTSYRDYLDRFRYYADARGADLTLWLRYHFGGDNTP